MKTKILLTSAIYLSGIMTIGHAQSLRSPIASPYMNVSAYSATQVDAFSFVGNQAALAQIKQAGAGIYSERRFLLAEVASYSAAVSLPTRLGNFGLALQYSGFKNFNESKIGLAYARGLGKKLDVGIQFNYYGYRVPAYGNASTINFEAGAIMHFTDKLHAGVQVYGPVGGKLGKAKDEKLAASYKAGLGYDASDQFFISAELTKEEDKAVNVTGGFQYQFAKRFFARAGFVSGTSVTFAGAGISWKDIRLDVSASYHPQLGFSPGILLMTNFGKRFE